jgi:hypothetical protein
LKAIIAYKEIHCEESASVTQYAGRDIKATLKHFVVLNHYSKKKRIFRMKDKLNGKAQSTVPF